MEIRLRVLEIYRDDPYNLIWIMPTQGKYTAIPCGMVFLCEKQSDESI